MLVSSEYRAFERAQTAGLQLLDEEQSQSTSWMAFPNRVSSRSPDPIQIFASGMCTMTSGDSRRSVP